MVYFCTAGDFERIAVFEGIDRLVLGAVIFEDAVNVFHPRHSPDEEQEQGDANDAIHQVKT